MLSLEEHRVPGVPDSVFYVPDFISEAEEVWLGQLTNRKPPF